MQSGQVSVWVPIVVGVIGLVGVIAGQLVSAWREDRRWEREIVREEIRWNRTRHFEDIIQWRSIKVKLYAQVNAMTREFIGHLIEMDSIQNQVDWDREFGELCGRWHALELQIFETVIICSEDMHKRVTALGSFIEKEVLPGMTFSSRKESRQHVKSLARLLGSVIAGAKLELQSL